MKLLPLLALATLLSGCGSDDESSGGGGSCTCAAQAVVNTGHRGTGVSSNDNPFPENTIESIERARAEGAQMAELDVVHSSDGVLVLMHDDTVDRTTNGSGCVGNLTVAEIQALDAASGTSLEGTGVKVPTLLDVLAAVDIGLNIEIKLRDDPSCPDSNRAKLAADVVAAIQGDGKSRPVLVSSFDGEVLTEVKKLDATVQVGLLTINPDDHAEATSRGLDALNLAAIAANAPAIETIHAAGLKANVWTVNGETLMRSMVDRGVDMVITDQPDVFAAVKSDLCASACP